MEVVRDDANHQVSALLAPEQGFGRAARLLSHHKPVNDTTPASVAILMATYDGQEFLPEQLSSLQSQTHQHWSLWVSDDGSSDNTLNILKEFQAEHSKTPLNITHGPQQGFASNFLSLVCNQNIQADYFAFCDQDDIWEPQKLERALTKLADVPDGIPALYCSRTALICEKGTLIGTSPLFQREPCFANALVQSIAGGNTIVINKAARELLSQVGMVDIVSHDWWAYLMVSGSGGKIIYDDYTSVRYRQHSQNLVGGSVSAAARFRRVHMLLRGRFKHWNDRNISALVKAEHLLTEESHAILQQFKYARRHWLRAPWHLHQSGIYRQTPISSTALYVAAAMRLM
ncbi:glycosyltransferase family 2 protein [Gilvimarinus agarilyticus]|uniref:glycosyltransferase family 2 protein n=1 Tax=Gilvimarinus agarilyticus TaxID=679259 RepID=UPI000A048237|nr:glycosyltransferase family 2 protein [Gilvimarinus agarilyticus]